MKLQPEFLGDERLFRMVDLDQGDIRADLSLIASMRRREGAPLERILLGEAHFRELLRQMGRPLDDYPAGDARVVRLTLFAGELEVGIDADDVETPLPVDSDNPHRP